MVLFGQLVIGPPGAGKTTFCHGMKMYLEAIDRKCMLINLDFANDITPYEPTVDVRNLISLEKVMEELDLGPNGSLVYCMEYLLENSDWLIAEIERLIYTNDDVEQYNYVIFDCPGQVELYTHYSSVQDLIHNKLLKSFDMRLTCVHLIDSVYCCNSTTFLSAALLVAVSMYRLALPHVNVLTKIDLLATHYKDSLPFNIDFYTECTNLNPLTRYIDEPFNANVKPQDMPEVLSPNLDDEPTETDEKKSQSARTRTDVFKQKHKRMTAGLCDLLTDYGMVSFIPCNIEDSETVGKALTSIDKCNGYSLAAAQASHYVEKIEKQQEHTTPSKFAADQAQQSMEAREIGAIHTDVEFSFMKSMHIMEKYEHEHLQEMNKKQCEETQNKGDIS